MSDTRPPRRTPPVNPTRRRALARGGALALLLGAPHIARGASIVAVRIWPAEDYTRVTIESDTLLRTTHQMVASPPRLAVDIHGLELSPTLRELVAKVRSDDPNIAGIRVGQYAPGVVRLVVDLKHDSKPQVFNLAPVAAYRHRLVFDLYPADPPDPLEQLIAQRMTELGQSPTASVAPPVPITEPDLLGELIAQRMGGASAPAPAPAPAERNRTPRPPAPPPRLPVRRTDRIIVIAIDAGHGGEDPGAIGPGGSYEKTVVLQIALKLRDRINSATVGGKPLRAYLTREGDYFVPLATRVEKARRVGADLFISLHADAFMRPNARGASVYALSERGASSTAARWLASKENASDQVGGVNLGVRDAHVQHALLDMSTAAQIKDSLALGNAVLRQIGQIGRLHKRTVERANFAVLRAPDIPSILVETAFISNPEEEQKLRSQTYQSSLADAVLNGIRQYFTANPPLARSRRL